MRFLFIRAALGRLRVRPLPTVTVLFETAYPSLAPPAVGGSAPTSEMS